MQSINLVNGNIITLDSKLPFAHSVNIVNGRIHSINETVKSDNTINLKGATVIPGFIDAHFHLKNYGKRLDQINLKGLKSLKEIEKIILLKLNDIKPGDWILGFGWDQNLWDNKSFPNSNFLDKITPNNPVYFTRIDGHSSWVNNYAISLTKKNN